ncbi:hypothetical protein DFJ58DRAFT_883324 [Suillus subalutaceus]|uniref:uncharacterized protein n=1 Tax=Suillus subalutaceus TaxID=48586 RepID=UPI001B884B9D|nr:uncharacterized protein DFJ58DRAFT_883324 [Suillus subalutaceus]KAG1824243.1 hypothetical protein DFJ58DRAFT_883324 [Suillus subalutaceus]
MHATTDVLLFSVRYEEVPMYTVQHDHHPQCTRSRISDGIGMPGIYRSSSSSVPNTDELMFGLTRQPIFESLPPIPCLFYGFAHGDSGGFHVDESSRYEIDSDTSITWRANSYFPYGQRMISGSRDKATRQWALKAGKEIKEGRGVFEEKVLTVAVERCIRDNACA